jgi:hypothetical protein
VYRIRGSKFEQTANKYFCLQTESCIPCLIYQKTVGICKLCKVKSQYKPQNRENRTNLQKGIGHIYCANESHKEAKIFSVKLIINQTGKQFKASLNIIYPRKVKDANT